jgi:hypothetical protein
MIIKKEDYFVLVLPIFVFFFKVYDFIERHNLAACEITESASYQFYRNYQKKQGPYKEDKTTNIA